MIRWTAFLTKWGNGLKAEIPAVNEGNLILFIPSSVSYRMLKKCDSNIKV